MDRAAWDTTEDVAELVRFASLRIPRRHLVLSLSGLVRAALEGAQPGPRSSQLAFAVAAVRAWCFHELSDEALRDFRGEFEQEEPWARWDSAADATEFLLHLALWRTDPPEPGLSWGCEQQPELFAGAAGALVSEVGRSLGARLSPPVARQLANEVRARIAYPGAIERDWVPQLPLIIAGAQVLTIVDWEVASVGAPHELSPEQLVQRDELLARAAPATVEQEAERRRVEAILASRDGTRAAPPPSFARAVQHLDEAARIASSPAPVVRPDVDPTIDRVVIATIGLVGAGCVAGSLFSVFDLQNGAFWLDALEPAHGLFALVGLGLLGASAGIWRRLAREDARHPS